MQSQGPAVGGELALASGSCYRALDGYLSPDILLMAVQIVLYQEADGDCPVVEFFREVSERVRTQARQRLQLLAEQGHQLRRPHAAYLEDGIHELRWHTGRVQYRILYFFLGRTAAILAHAITKEDVVPPADLDRAKRRKTAFHTDPTLHTYLGGFNA